MTAAAPPSLPRRVPGASGSPRPPVRVDLGVISEDLRQRVLTAIASELERDEAERRRNSQEQDGAGSFGELGTRQVVRTAGEGLSAGGIASPGNVSSAGQANRSDASLAASYGVIPANGGSPRPENGGDASPGNGVGTSTGNVPPWERDALLPGTPAQQGDTLHGEAADRDSGAAEDAAVAQEPGGTTGEAADARDAVAGPDGAAPVPGVPLPRRAPGANGAPAHRPPNCGVSTCRRPCSAAGWTRRRTPSHFPGSPPPDHDQASAARRPRTAANPRRRCSRPLRHHPPALRPAHQRSPDHRHPGRPPPRHGKRQAWSPRHREPRGVEPAPPGTPSAGSAHWNGAAGLELSRRGPRCRPRRWRRRPPCRWAARRWRPLPHPPCRWAARTWQPRPCSHRRPNLSAKLCSGQTRSGQAAPAKPVPAQSCSRQRPVPAEPAPAKAFCSGHASRTGPRGPATAGSPIQAGRRPGNGRGRCGAALPLPAATARPPSGRGGPGGRTASLA